MTSELSESGSQLLALIGSSSLPVHPSSAAWPGPGKHAKNNNIKSRDNISQIHHSEHLQLSSLQPAETIYIIRKVFYCIRPDRG